MNQVRERSPRGRVACGMIVLCLALAPAVSQAQAWIPQKGSSSVSLDYSEILNKKHYTSSGDEVDVGHTTLEILTLSASYSPSDRVLVNASIPLVKSRYIGEGLGGHDTEIDNGTWHDTVTDLQFTVHYQVSDGPVAFAPYVGAVIPTHDYVTFGHSAPGRGLEEYWLGFYAASSLNEWIPRSYVQVRGNYAFVEKVVGISHDRTNLSLELGHFLNEAWSVRTIVSRQWTHGGIDVPVDPTNPQFPVLFSVHDILAAEELLNVGAGASWTISDRLSVYGFYIESIEGENAHKVDHRVSLGMSYGLGGH